MKLLKCNKSINFVIIFWALIMPLLLLGCSDNKKTEIPSYTSVKISQPETISINVFLNVMDVFNNKDASKFKSINLQLKNASISEIQKYLNSYQEKNFILHYVEINEYDNNSISGIFLYSREGENSSAIGRDINLSTTSFELVRVGNQWKIKSMSSYNPVNTSNKDKLIYDFELKEKGLKKYGVEDLSKLK